MTTDDPRTRTSALASASALDASRAPTRTKVRSVADRGARTSDAATDLDVTGAHERCERGWRLERVQILPSALEDVFPFFERPENLEALTPPYLRFEILTARPVPMHLDARIEYRIRLFGVPMRWRTRIAAYEPGRRFVDVQESGPYALWEHTHEFERHPRGTRMFDRVDYRPRFGPLGTLARGLFVARMVERIFDFRARAVAERFTPRPRA